MARALREYGRPQTNKERLEEGYIWDGQGTEDENGVKTYLVNGKYLQKPFVFKGLKRDEDEFVMRFVASMPRASSGILMTGMGKDKCHRQNRKLAALDNTHGFFCERVKDMVRIDIQKTWPSQEALQADLDKLPFKAQLVVRTTDDRYPEHFIDPHFYHILPEGKGVWNNKKHHKLLNRVIAGLNKMYAPLGADPGGMSHPYSGKLVTSPHNDYFVPEGSYTVDDEGNRVMPSLGDYAKGLDISMGLEKMARHLSRAILSDGGFNAAESNTYFSWPSKAARTAARDLFKAGADLTDESSTINKVEELVTEAFYAEHEITTVRGRAAMAKVIRSCARWAVVHFDPSKMDKAGRDRGAAHHLMTETDDAKTKMQKGQKYSAEAKVAATRHKMTLAMIPIVRAGKEPTVADVMEATGLSRNTVKRHFSLPTCQLSPRCPFRIWLRRFTTYQPPFILVPSSSQQPSCPIFRNPGSSRPFPSTGGTSNCGRHGQTGVPATVQRATVRRLQAGTRSISCPPES